MIFYKSVWVFIIYKGIRVYGYLKGYLSIYKIEADVLFTLKCCSLRKKHTCL